MQGLSARDMLFGDVPMDVWATPGKGAEPWLSFEQVRALMGTGNKAQASATLHAVTVMSGLESRQYLQAWHFLRQLGATPSPDVAKQVLGVVVEASLDVGLDTLAAYADHTARYYNYSGSGVVWEHPNGSLDGVVESVLEAARAIVPHIGPWDGPRRPPPPPGNVRLNMLTPSGVCFGEGPFAVLGGDPMAGRLLGAATGLMQALTALQQR
jgi:hypothetical protein